MGLRELRSLATVAEPGNITRTAEKLYLSPPAIHKQWRCLQTELGVQLYDKVGRRLQLTPAAEIVLPYLRELQAIYDAAIDATGNGRPSTHRRENPIKTPGSKRAG